MDALRKKIIGKWNVKNVSALPSKSFGKLFDLYDEIVFKGEITERIKQIEAEGVIITIGFNEDINGIDNFTFRLCDVVYYYTAEGTNYVVYMTPWVLSRIEHSESNVLRTIFGTDDVAMCVLLSFEHQLMHLLMLLWDYAGTDTADITFGTHGRLYECVSSTIFDKNTADVIPRLRSEKTRITVPKATIAGRYSYFENSCYVDSLTTVLLLCKSDVFRNAFFRTNASLTEYTTKNPQGEYILNSPCSSHSDIHTEDEFRAIISQVQAILFADFSNVISRGKLQECTDLRWLFFSCYPNIRTDHGGWAMFSVSELYALYAYMFPELLATLIPAMRIDNGEKTDDRILETPRDVFLMWEFMEPVEEIETGIAMKFEEMNYDILVFRNSGVPAIVNYGSTEPEEVEEDDWVPKTRMINKLPSGWRAQKVNGERIFFHKSGKKQKHIPEGTVKAEETIMEVETTTKTVYKARAFGETILDDKYEMIGAVMLHGTTPGKEGGVHYVSYVNTREGWYYYNDIGDTWKSLDTFPQKVLTEKGGIKPELYIYSRV